MAFPSARHDQATSIDAGARAQTIAGLNAGLAAMIDLGLSAKQAHWNVRGPNFQGLHELFDVVAQEARQWADDLAERAVALGGTAHGTLQDVASGSDLRPFPTDERRWQALVGSMHERMLSCADQLRMFAGQLDAELATQDLVVEIVRGLEKRAWMVEAHLDAAR